MLNYIGIYAVKASDLKVIYHPLYGMNNYVLIWGDWPLCEPYKETLVPHLVATLIYLSQFFSYYIRGDISPLARGIQASQTLVLSSIPGTSPSK